MHELQGNGYYPLTRRHVDAYIPAAPGSYTLSVRLASGAHYTFHNGETANLQASLQMVLRGEDADFPYAIREYVERFQCYLTFFVFPSQEHAVEIEKMLLQTSDPIARLRVIRSN